MSHDSSPASGTDDGPAGFESPTLERPGVSRSVEQLLDLKRVGIVMTPDRDRPEEAWGVLNPASARSRDGELYLFPRVVAEGNYSRIGITSVNFDAAGDPVSVERLGIVLEPHESYELTGTGGGGVEDPRITYLPLLDTYVMTYTALGPHGARIALAASRDLHTWDRLGLLHFEPMDGVEIDRCDNKDCVIFPLAVLDPTGRPAFALLHRPIFLVPQQDGTWEGQLPPGVVDRRPSIWISYVPVDRAQADIQFLTHVYGHHLLAQPLGNWEYHHIGAGAPPILSEEGWLLYYHGVFGSTWAGIQVTPGSLRYQTGVMLLHRDDPRRVLYRSARPVLLPERGDELEGIVPNVVFPTAVDVRGQRVDVYYGAADERTAAATTRIASSVLLGPSAPTREETVRHIALPRGLSSEPREEGTSGDVDATGARHGDEGVKVMHVSDTMTRRVEVVDPDMTLAEAARRMRVMDIGMLPVQEGDEVVGVITDRDMTVRAIARELDPKTAIVRDVMTPDAVFCYEDETLESAANTMGDNQVRRLLVLDRSKRLAGVISLDDVAGVGDNPMLVEEVLERAAARPDHARQEYKRILVALDGSRFAERVISAVEPLAHEFGSTVTLLQAVAPAGAPLVAGAAGGTTGAADAQAGAAPGHDHAQEEAASYLAGIQQQLESRGLTVRCEAPEGPASEVILRHARQMGADLIALTTHGRTGVERVLLGSVAEDVIRRAPCLVLLVRVQHGR